MIRPLALAAALALPQPALAEGSRDASRTRSVALGLAAVAAIALAVRAAEREDEREEEREEAEARRLPSDCLALVRGLDGPVRLLDPDCLDRRVERADDIPLGCAVTLRTPEGPRGFATGFDPACLRRAGWEMD